MGVASFGGFYVVIELYYLVMEAKQGVFHISGPVRHPRCDILLSDSFLSLIIEFYESWITLLTTDTDLLIDVMPILISFPFVCSIVMTFLTTITILIWPAPRLLVESDSHIEIDSIIVVTHC